MKAASLEYKLYSNIVVIDFYITELYTPLTIVGRHLHPSVFHGALISFKRLLTYLLT